MAGRDRTRRGPGRSAGADGRGVEGRCDAGAGAGARGSGAAVAPVPRRFRVGAGGTPAGAAGPHRPPTAPDRLFTRPPVPGRLFSRVPVPAGRARTDRRGFPGGSPRPAPPPPFDAGRGEVAVTEYQFPSGGPRRPGEVAHGAHPYSGPRGGGEAVAGPVPGVPAVLLRNTGDHVQPGRDTAHHDPGQTPVQRLDQRVPPGAVEPLGPAKMAVVPAGGDELGEHGLLRGRIAEIGRPLDCGQVLQPGARRHQPAETQAGGERLADRPGVRDLSRRKPLERADRSRSNTLEPPR